MHDIRWIRDNADVFKTALRARGWDGLTVEETTASIVALDDDRRDVIASTQALQERRNAVSREIGQAMAAKDGAHADALKAEVTEIKTILPDLETRERKAVTALDAALAALPNLPLDTVPVGVSEADNVEVRRFGTPPSFPDGFTPKEHFDIGEALGLMDFETAGKLSGARFVVTKGALARMERALGAFMLDLHTGEHGYTEINPPALVRDDAVFGVGQLPKFEDDLFRTTNGFWLISTSEVPLTNLVRESIVEEAALPLRFTAQTPCFRSEAGSAGRDTRGMIRQHQFTKVEMVSVTTPEASAAEHERMTGCAEEVLKRLGLHYRVMALCTGDMGFSSARTYDLEVWLPGQGQFREISSCSVCGEFQARRMAARYRPTGAKTTRFVHTLNGSGVAVGRALVAVLETYQNPDGSVTVPDVLRPYMGGLERIAGRS